MPFNPHDKITGVSNMLLMRAVKLLPSKFLSLQARQPTGFFGRYVMTAMFNKGNADLNAFVKDLLALQSRDKVLEIGFGPGELVQKMAQVTTQGLVEGIDFSDVMWKRAAQRNKIAIASGKVRLQQGDCRRLPYADNTFNKLCSVNVLYFWEEPETHVKEMYRVLQTGGKAVIGFRDSEQIRRLKLSEEIFHCYSKQAVLDLLAQTGFANVRLEEKPASPFTSYCAVASK